MMISRNKYVEIEYKLTVDGELVDQSEPGDPLGFVSGIGQIVSGLDNAIQGKVVGDVIDVSVSADEGYGQIEKSLFQELPKDNFPKDLKIEPDMMFQAETPHGVMSFRISEVRENSVLADLNHPLAGKDLNFNAKIVSIREATEDELSDNCESHECTGCGCH